uniref:Transthyretin-like family protein n=1 Tax=Panagrolaimus sp. JU765 TaxID=591449 RepID=A0AC34QRI0_9BILA
MSKLGLIGIFLVVLPFSDAFNQQSVGVRGQFMCGTTPAANVNVKLWNKNDLQPDDQLAQAFTDSEGNFQISGGVGALFNMDVHLKKPDDQLAQAFTDSQGNFQISGGVGAVFNMDVHLKIYHDCDRWLPCQRKLDIKIPSQYVTRTPNVEQWFDLGTINLQIRTKDEETSCINRRKRFVNVFEPIRDFVHSVTF